MLLIIVLQIINFRNLFIFDFVLQVIAASLESY